MKNIIAVHDADRFQKLTKNLQSMTEFDLLVVREGDAGDVLLDNDEISRLYDVAKLDLVLYRLTIFYTVCYEEIINFWYANYIIKTLLSLDPVVVLLVPFHDKKQDLDVLGVDAQVCRAAIAT